MAFNLPNQGIFGIDPNYDPSSDPFHALTQQAGIVRTDDGRYFMPFKNTSSYQLYQEGMDPSTGGYSVVQHDQSGNPIYGPDGQLATDSYASARDYYNALDPYGVGVIGSGRQNAIGLTGATRGDYNGDYGYFFNGNDLAGAHPATTMGQKGTESGLTQFVVSSLLSGAGAELGAGGGGDAFGGYTVDAGTGDVLGSAAAPSGAAPVGGEETGLGTSTAPVDPSAPAAPLGGDPTSTPAPEQLSGPPPDPVADPAPVGEQPPDPTATPALGAPAGDASAGQAFPSGGGGPGLSAGGDFGPPVETPSASNSQVDDAIRSGQDGTPPKGDDLLSQETLDKALKYGPLALGAYSAYKGRQNAKQYSSELRDIGAPQRDIGNQLVAQYKSGQLNDADKFAVDQWEQAAIARARAYYAKAGISDSSMATSAESEIHAKAAAMRQEALNNTLQLGLSALNIVDKYQAQAIQAEMAGDQATVKQVQDFLNSYGNWLRMLPALTGSGGKTTPAPAAATT